jgi:hypothetical protein
MGWGDVWRFSPAPAGLCIPTTSLLPLIPIVIFQNGRKNERIYLRSLLRSFMNAISTRSGIKILLVCVLSM